MNFVNRSIESFKWIGLVGVINGANGKIQQAPVQQRVFVFEQITWPLKDGKQQG